MAAVLITIEETQREDRASKVEAEAGGMHLQVKEPRICGNPPKAEGGLGEIFLQNPRDTWILEFQLPEVLDI